MLLKTALVVTCFVALVCGQSSVTPDQSYNAAGYWRGYNCSNSGQTAVGFGVGYALSAGPNSGVAGLDAVLVTMSTPKTANTSSGFFNFYFGYLLAAADWNKQADTLHIAAAGAELISSMYSIYCWYDMDGNPGFQYDPTQGPLYCNDTEPASKQQDCCDYNSKIDLGSITWNSITQQSSACPSGYQSGCSITSFTVSDSSNIISFQLQLASQPVFVNQVSLKPDYGKITITINYPWTSMQSKLINWKAAKVLLLAGTEGRAAAGAKGFTTNVQGDPAVAWAVGAKVAYFNWAGTATIGTSSSTVYIQSITDTQINALPAPSVLFSLQTVVVFWLQKIVIPIWSAYGYSTTFLFFSWDETTPQTISWDPKVGVTDNGSMFLASNPVFLLTALCLLFIYQRRQ